MATGLSTALTEAARTRIGELRDEGLSLTAITQRLGVEGIKASRSQVHRYVARTTPAPASGPDKGLNIEAQLSPPSVVMSGLEFRTLVRRAELSAAHGGTRPILECAHLELHASGRLRIATADGFILVIQEWPEEIQGDDQVVSEVNIPIDDLKAAMAQLSTDAQATLASVSLDLSPASDEAPESLRVTVAIEGRTISTTIPVLSERFPKYRELVLNHPESSDAPRRVALNGKYLDRLAKLAELTSPSKTVLIRYGTDHEAVSFRIPGDLPCHGAVMPMYLQEWR